ncbi:hypothetical protein A6R68_21930 [Neotoma lepida]|uniref:Ig-like domain-containing protein n=1 Tax=Neotoma lepida TaxID=56216 RepID=A0A1A6HN58_NEOLE|nr:hypothetical protein A6R68_21930 [Neotoma lepida]
MSQQLQKAHGSGGSVNVSVQTFTGNSLAGLSLDLRNPVLAGAISKPTLRAVPRNVVTLGDQVTFFCEGPLEAKEYHLYKEGSPDYLVPTTLLETENKATFSISPVEWNNAGHYWCNYTNTNGISEKSDFLELVVTGKLRKPMIWAHPSSVITLRSPVTIWCEVPLETLMYVIYKEGSPESWDQKIQIDHNNKAKLTIPSVTQLQAGRYHCYSYTSAGWSERSDTLELVVTGKRTLRNLSIKCHSQDKVALAVSPFKG